MTTSMSPTPSTVPELYNARAEAYDTKTTFHQSLATQYLAYASPRAGDSLLDLACGTGLVTFAFAPILQQSPEVAQSSSSSSRTTPHPKIIGIDISPGMLAIARSKLPPASTSTSTSKANTAAITFLEHDITDLTDLSEDDVVEGTFDIITVCSALVLLPDPGKAIAHWAKYLRRGVGRLVVDIPHPKSMLSLKLLSRVAPEFHVPVLGDRNWIVGPESLRDLLRDAGLQATVIETGVFEDIPARTEEGRDEWRGEEGGRIWEEKIRRSFEGLGEEEMERAKRRFVEEWEREVGADGLVREEGRLYVGVGVKM